MNSEKQKIDKIDILKFLQNIQTKGKDLELVENGTISNTEMTTILDNSIAKEGCLTVIPRKELVDMLKGVTIKAMSKNPLTIIREVRKAKKQMKEFTENHKELIKELSVDI